MSYGFTTSSSTSFQPDSIFLWSNWANLGRSFTCGTNGSTCVFSEPLRNNMTGEVENFIHRVRNALNNGLSDQEIFEYFIDAKTVEEIWLALNAAKILSEEAWS